MTEVAETAGTAEMSEHGERAVAAYAGVMALEARLDAARRSLVEALGLMPPGDEQGYFKAISRMRNPARETGEPAAGTAAEAPPPRGVAVRTRRLPARRAFPRTPPPALEPVPDA